MKVSVYNVTQTFPQFMLTFPWWSSGVISELWENWEFFCSAVIELIVHDSKYTDFPKKQPPHLSSTKLLECVCTFRYNCWGISTVLLTRPSMLFFFFILFSKTILHSIFTLNCPDRTPSKWILLSLPSIPSFSVGYDPLYL